MASLLAIEECVQMEPSAHAIDEVNGNKEDHPRTPKSPSHIRIESVDEESKEEGSPDQQRQQTNPMVFKRAHTVMLTEEMQWFEDDFVKLEPLGEPGTFGMAFKCHKKTEPNTFYAVKQINKAKFYFNETKGVLQNMKNEIDIMNNLSKHEHICQLHETREDRNYIYLILDFLSGGELYGKIEENEELEEKEAQFITKQILSAIQYMHQHNVAHLDLKPDNILFVNKSPQSPIKIIDFGEARIVSSTQKLNQKIGTPYYMAPEIIEQIPYFPFPADMWSVGVIIFCMLFGFVPFHAEEESEIFDKIRGGFKNQVLDGYGAFFPKDIPVSDDAMDIIGGILVSDPGSRFTVTECLEHRWIRGNLSSRASRNRLSTPSRVQKRHSMKKLFLVEEDPITIEEDDEESEYEEMPQIEAPQNGIIKKGYLRKEGKLFKSWKKRWFILQNNGQVTYYHSHSDLEKPITEFTILNATIHKSNKIQHGMIIVTLQRNWKFAAINDKQRNEWIRAFEQSAKRKNKQKNTLHVDHNTFTKIKQSMNETDHISLSELNRDNETTHKIEEEIDKKMLLLMNDLDIPHNARPQMYDLDKKQKIKLIEKYIQQQMEKKTHLRGAFSDQLKLDDKRLFDHNPARPQSYSLATQSLLIDNKLKTAQNSIFGAKHDRCCSALIKATKPRIQYLKNDKDILRFVLCVFDKKEEKKEIENEDNKEEENTEIKRTKTRTKRSSVVTAYNGKYVNQRDKTISFGSLIECMEYMLKSEWSNEPTQRLYEKLVKSISLNHKAKIFSIGVERTTKNYLMKGKKKDCFVGNEAIDWLIKAKFVKNSDDKRERAKDLGNSFYTKGFIKHVSKQLKFKDEKLWYQFNDELIDKQCLIETKSMNNVKSFKEINTY